MTATPVLELGTRGPAPTDGLPTTAQYVTAATLATNALFDHTTSGVNALDFDGNFRLEFDVSLPSGTSWDLIEVTDQTSSRTVMKVNVTAGNTRSVVFTVDDGTTTETHTFYGLQAGRLAAKAVRFRLAVEWSPDGSVQVDYADASDADGTLSSAAWSTVASASSALAIIAPSIVSYTQPASTNDQHVKATDAAIGISGDIDVRSYLALTSATGTQNVSANWFFSATKSWYHDIDADKPRLWTSGTGGGDSFMTSTATLASAGYSPGDWFYLRVTYDVTAKVATFYTSDDGVTWTQLGSTVGGSQTALNTSSTSMCMFQDIGAGNTSTAAWVELYDGIDGTLVARCDVADSADTTSAWTGSVDGLSWDPQGSSLTRTASGRFWEVDGGTSRLRLIELRILAAGSEVASITGSSVSDPPGSTHTEDSLVWSVDGNAATHSRGDWDDITSSARIPEGGIGFRRGRTTDQGLHLAGELTAVLDNRTREFEPEWTGSIYYPMIRPLVPLRFCATYSGTTYPLWRGVTRKFLPRYDEPSDTDSVAELAGVDAFRLFSIAKTGGTMSGVLAGLSPIASWPLTDTGATLDDVEGTNHLTPTSLAQGAESPFFGNKNQVAYFDGVGYAQDTAADSVVEITGDCTLAFSINTDTGGDYHIASVYGTSGCYFGVELDCADNQQPVVRWIRNDGSPTDAGNDVTLDLPYGYFTDSKPHVVVCTYDQSADTLVVYVDGVKVATNTDAVPAGNGSPTVAGTPTIRVGAEGTHGSGTANFVGLLGYVAVFDSVLTDGQALSITRARVDGFRTQTPAARVNALLDAYGWPAAARDIDTATTVEPADPEAIFDGVTSGTNHTNANIVVSIPATAVVGGYAYAGISWPSNRTMDTVPAGWTSVDSDQSGATFQDVETEVWRHLVAEGEPGTTVTFIRSHGAGDHAWICVATSEVDETTQETATASTGAAASTSHTAPTVTAAEGDLLLTFHASFSTTTTLTSYTSGPSGMVKLAEQNSANKGSTQRANLAAWIETELGAGATGARTATRSASEKYATISLAINAAVPSGTDGSLAAKDMADQAILAELQAVAAAEGGEFFIDASGNAVFRSSGWRAANAATVQITFGNIDAEEDYRTVSYRYDEDTIINEATVTDADGTEATIVDQDSIDTYGLRSHTETVDLTGATAASARAQAIIDAYSSPRLLLNQLSVFPAADPTVLFPALLDLELGERTRVKHRPPSWTNPDAMLDQQSHAESLGVQVVRGTSDWTFALTGSPAS